ncbi:MAG: hypothetical protein ACFFB6_04810, partial [Promethearchaeota archaeon]
EVRWGALTNNEGHGLLIFDVGGTYLNISAWPYSMKDLESVAHNYELPRREFITFNIDYKQKGVGGDIPALAVVHNEYLLKKNEKISYSFLFRGYTKNMGDIDLIANRKPQIF